MRKLIVVVVMCAAVLMLGCATVLGSAVDTAGRSVGESVGQSVGDSVSRSIEQRLTPMMMNWYVSSMFAIAFNSGGYAIGHEDYEPGEWTRWRGVGDDDEGWMERAYLGDDESGNQWWRVQFYEPDEDASFVLEGLFSEGQSRLLRLRRQFPGDEEPVEVPVEKDTHYVPPRQLADESIEGAKVGTVKVTVPAGTFTADHIRFGDAAGGTWEWWLTDEVPGRAVRYASSSASQSEEGSEEALDPDEYDVQLEAYGDDATSMLGVF